MLITNELVANLYLATMGRTMASAGYDYWTNTGDYDGQDGRPEGTNLTTMEELSASFAAQPEYAALYPEGTTDEAFVNQIFQNLFQRDAASSYWADEITAGNTTRAEAVMSIISGAIGDDAAILVNRAEVAIDLADNTVLTAADAMDADTTAALNAITSDVATKATAVTAVNTVVADNADAAAVAAEEAAFTIELGAKTAIVDSDGVTAASVSDAATEGTLSSLDGYTLTVTLDNATQLAAFNTANSSTAAAETYTETIKIASTNEMSGTAYITDATGANVIGTADTVDMNTTGAVSTYAAQNLNADGVTIDAAATATEDLSFSITFNASATVADIDAILEGLTVSTNGGDGATDVELRGEKTVTVALTNAAGDTVASDTQTIKNADGTRELADGDTTTDTQTFDIANDTTVAIQADDTVDNTGAPSQYETAVLTVSISENGQTSDVLSFDGTTVTTQSAGTDTLVKVSGTVVGTATGGSNGEDLVITFNSAGTAATAANVQSLVNNIHFSTDAVGEDRTVTFTMTEDGYAMGSTDATVTVYGGTYTAVDADGDVIGSALADLITLDNADLANDMTVDGNDGVDSLTMTLDAAETLDDTFVVQEVENISMVTSNSGSSIDMTNVTDADVAVTGNQTLTLTNIGTTVTDIDASASTGALAATVTGAATHNIEMATVNSDVTFTGVLDSTDTITGGAGTSDDIVANEIAAGTTLAFTSSDVETITLNAADTADATITYDGTNNAGATTVNVDTLIAGQTVVVTDVNADTTTLDASGVAGDSTITVATAGSLAVSTSNGDSTVDMGTTLDALDTIVGGSGDDTLTAELAGQKVYATTTAPEVTTITLGATAAITDIVTLDIDGVTYSYTVANTAFVDIGGGGDDISALFKIDGTGAALASSVGVLTLDNAGVVMTYTPATGTTGRISNVDYTDTVADTNHGATITTVTVTNTITADGVNNAPVEGDIVSLTIDGTEYTATIDDGTNWNSSDVAAQFSSAAGTTLTGYTVTLVDNANPDTLTVESTTAGTVVAVSGTITDSDMIISSTAVETINLDVTADTTVTMATATVDNATELNVTGSEDLTITSLDAAVVTIEAGTYTGNLTVTTELAADTLFTVNAGSGTSDRVNFKAAEDINNVATPDFALDGVEIVGLDGGSLTMLDADFTANGSNTLTIMGDDTNVDMSGLTAANSVDITDAALIATTTITGGAGSDTLRFTDSNSLADDLTLVSGIETIILGDATTAITMANDINVATGETLTINASALTDTVANGTHTLTLDASAETNGTLVIIGGDAADTITTGELADTVTLGTGADTLVATAATSNGTTGRDTITDFTSGTDIVSLTYTLSSTGTEVIFDGTLTNAATYGDVAESIKADTSGNTTFIADSNRLYIDTNGDSALNASDYSVILSDVAALAEGDIAYHITGVDGSANTITTGSANDTVTGANGIDTITTGAGDDVVTGTVDTGTDVINLGTGDDTYVLAEVSTVDTVEGGTDVSGTDTDALALVGGVTVANTVDFGTYTGFESLIASAAVTTVISFSAKADFFTDTAIQTIDLSADTNATGSNVIDMSLATGAIYTITGSAGVDTITGSTSGDIIDGGAGADVITMLVDGSAVATAGALTTSTVGMDIIANGAADTIDLTDALDTEAEYNVFTTVNTAVAIDLTVVDTNGTGGDTGSVSQITGTYNADTDVFTATAAADMNAIMFSYDNTQDDAVTAATASIIVTGVTSVYADGALSSGIITLA